jgi:hypothetical protein
MPRGRTWLVVGLSLGALVAGVAAAVSVAGATGCAPHDPVCEYLASATEAEPVTTITGTLPGAIEPAPVNQVEMAEFWAKVEARRERGKLAATAAEPVGLELVPALRAGWTGWCLVLKANPAVEPLCPVDPTADAMIAWEGWEDHGTGTRGYVLTGREVGAVAVDEGPLGFPTHAVPGFARSLRAAIVVIPSPYPPSWSDGFEPVVGGVRLSGERGISAPPHAPSTAYAAHGWHAPQQPPDGVCGIAAHDLSRLRARSGDVLDTLTPTPGTAGRGFLSCANTRYSLGGTSMQAAILLDAARPGSRPVDLPGARRVAGRHGLFTTPGREGTILGRRVGHAWLLVEGGTLPQRELLLAHLRATVLA